VKAPELLALALVLVAVPFAVVVLTSFVKFAVVLAILRRSLGGGAVPPASVAGALALLFALFVFAPVGEEAWKALEPALARGEVASLASAAPRAADPVRRFLEGHTPERERASFLELQRQLRPPAERDRVGARDLVVLAPAFAAAELKAAFQVGFLLFLPFLVIDLLVASVLAAVGMNTLSVEAVALPLKLLLFVVADGWHVLLRGLVLGYT
jgi:type III secretion protein R